MTGLKVIVVGLFLTFLVFIGGNMFIDVGIGQSTYNQLVERIKACGEADKDRLVYGAVVLAYNHVARDGKITWVEFDKLNNLIGNCFE